MTRERKTVTREELFEQVWSKPMTKLAKEYGLSDVGLAKICKSLEIPRPERGYWAKVEAGKKVQPKPKLKKHKEGMNSQVTITSSPQSEANGGLAKRPIEIIPVPKILSRPHNLIEKTQAALKSAKEDGKGILIPKNKIYFDCRVTSGTSDRACLVMDTLIKALEKRDITVKIEKTDNRTRPKTVITIDGEVFDICIEEKIRSVEKIPTPEEKKKYADSWWWKPSVDYVPTGMLTLKILDFYREGLRKTWSDGKVQRVEDCLGRFLEGLRHAAVAQKAWKKQMEDRKLEREEREKRNKELRRLKHIEEKKIEKLTGQVNNWITANNIHQYLDALSEKTNDVEGLSEWISWARQYAEKLDPLNKPQNLALKESEIGYWY